VACVDAVAVEGDGVGDDDGGGGCAGDVPAAE